MAFVAKNKPNDVPRQVKKPAAATETERVCPRCKSKLDVGKLWENRNVCSCGYHFKLKARDRVALTVDVDSFEPLWEDITSVDVLEFPGYENKLELSRYVAGEADAVVCGRAKISGRPCILFAMDPFFMMGSMGAAVGEKITRAFELATEEGLPVVGFTVSGGARMQEGLISLMQMAKTSAAVQRHSAAGLLYLTVLTNPTTGGVTASFAMLGDVIFAEPGATVGFAGARVIEQTVGKKLPQGFQTAEFLLAHGFADAIVPRDEQRWAIGNMLKLHAVSA
ncbi:MAG: acetyl-CoA carboxylase carboxyl transferase subunit beta [Clostridiales Family XIII bacterium]|jgi:acetyl-CoA carboxylase carboxyl transferase subunit beta|nr:acetyl-CoA carboxylase carboxyl transferase subunit beta [Clostridiales Family XIII bacterium]